MPLLAMSSFFYTWTFFGLETGSEALSSDLDKLNATAASICALDHAGQCLALIACPTPQASASL